MNIIFMGKPGAGKGTQSQRLCEDYPFKIIAAGDLIRQAVKDKTPTGIEIKKAMNEGKLIDDKTVISLLEPQLDKYENVLLDGFPRTRVQAEELSKRKDIDGVIFLHVEDEVVINRVSSRWMVNLNGTQYSFNCKKTADKFVAEKGGVAFQRKDDTKEIISKRLETYREETKPLLSYYEEKGILYTLDGSQDIETVNTAICQCIEKMKSQKDLKERSVAVA